MGPLSNVRSLFPSPPKNKQLQGPLYHCSHHLMRHGALAGSMSLISTKEAKGPLLHLEMHVEVLVTSLDKMKFCQRLFGLLQCRQQLMRLTCSRRITSEPKIAATSDCSCDQTQTAGFASPC